MKRWWPREVLRFVDAWACREGTPEDDEDAKAANDSATSNNSPVNPVAVDGVLHGAVSREQARRRPSVGSGLGGAQADLADQRIWEATDTNVDHEWVELEDRGFPDEELGKR